MKGFRIIAIKTGNKPTGKSTSSLVKDNDFLKVLSPNTFYPFYSHYEFVDNETIKYKPESDIDIYKLKEQNDISISINAIVGSNGSGKSTLIELIYWANYNIGCKLDLIKGKGNKSLVPFKFLNIELIYTVDNNSFKKLKFEDSNIYINKSQRSQFNEIVFNPENYTKLTKLDLPEFFYSIVVNYSHYALNTNEIGTWINHLFHKNDGYQTPIVLNPMRKEGNIDINTEKNLLSRRLQANLLEPIEESSEEISSLRNIVNEKVAKELRLTYIGNFQNLQESIIPLQKNDELCKALIKHFNIEKLKNNEDLGFYETVLLNSIYRKMIKIAHNEFYKPFSAFLEITENVGEHKYTIKSVDRYVKKIKDSNSHIIFKVKGAILYLKYFEMIFSGREKEMKRGQFVFNVNELSTKIQKIREEEKDYLVNTFMMAPPSIFKVDILLENNLTLDMLSSGEKQRIHSLSSIIYHIMNVNSVEVEKSNSNESFTHYHYINIILDEIELYYHPNWQRTYINDLISYINKIDKNKLNKIKGINITFLTHSPYILSDIPNTNILYLEQGGDSSKDKNDFKTLGANIHEMLTNSFFMDKTIGEYSILLIQEIIDFHSRVSKSTVNDKVALEIEYKEKEHYLKYIANNIGENYIRGILRNHIEKIEKKLGVWSDDEEFKKLENKYLYLKSIRDDKNKIPN